MKLTKKALSLLLAVVMIMSSMSVCFGEIAPVIKVAAANDTAKVTAFVNAATNYIKEFGHFPALTADVTTNGKNDKSKEITKTWNYAPETYAEYKAFCGVIDALHAAAFGLDEYNNCKTHKNNNVCGDGWYLKTTQANGCTDWGYVKQALISAMGNNYTTLQSSGSIDNLLNAVLNYDEVPAVGGNLVRPSTNKDGEDYNTGKDSEMPARIWNDFVLHAPGNAADQIITNASSLNDIPDKIYGKYYYRLGLARCGQGATSECDGNVSVEDSAKSDGYHMAIQDMPTSQAASSAPTTAPQGQLEKTIDDKAGLVKFQSTLTTYSNYFNTLTKNDVIAISNNIENLRTVLAAIKDAKAGVTNATYYSRFFGTVYYDRTVTNIENAINFLGFAEIIETLEELCATPLEGMSTEALSALLTEINENYNKYADLPEADKAELLAAYPTFDPADVSAKIKAIQDYYELAYVAEQKATIDQHIAEFEGAWTMEDVDEERVNWPTINAAFVLVEKDYKTLKSMDKKNIIAVCGEGYIERVEALYRYLAEFDVASNFNDEYTSRYKNFYNSIQTEIPQADTPTLLASLQKYDTWFAELKSIIDGMSTGLSEEVAQMLFDGVNNDMVNYINNAYAVLNARVETQINFAYSVYDNHVKLYGPTVHFVSLDSYNLLTQSIGRIDVEAYDYLQATNHFDFSEETIEKYEKLFTLIPEYDKFAQNRGFDTFKEMAIANFEREDDPTDIFRENTDKDDDGKGEFISNDAQIDKIITVIDAALTSESVSKVLGLDLGTMLNDLVEDAILSDSIINTVVEMLYPLVLSEFGKVFANDLPAEAEGFAVTYQKGLHSTLKGAGFELYPDLLATELGKTKNAAAYKDTISRLNAAYNEYKTKYPNVGADKGDVYATELDPDPEKQGKVNAMGNAYVVLSDTPWNSMQLRDAETGKVNLTWGIDAAKERGVKGDELKALFYETFDDAVEGLKPLLLAIVANKEWKAPSVTGFAYAVSSALVKVVLNLSATPNSGYANLIVPIFETLGVSYTNVSDIEGKFLTDTTKDVEQIIKAIFDPIFAFIGQIGKAPLDTILGVLPNLCYALSAGMLQPLLGMLKTNISYVAPVEISPLLSGCNINVKDPSGSVAVDVGKMLKIPALDNIYADGINGLFALLGLEGLPKFNQGLVAVLGELTTIKTQRTEWVYTAPAAGYAYNVVADKSEVLAYLAEYLLTALGQDGVLDMIMGLFSKEEAPAEGEEGETPVEPETPAEPEAPAEPDLLTTILANVSSNPKKAIAAIIELFNFSEYETKVLYNWFDGSNYQAGNVVGFNPATEIYLNPDNDWTQEKADYLYATLPTLINTIIAMLPEKDAEGEDADAPETVAEGEDEITEEEAAKTLSTILGDLIGGLYSDKTLTSIAAILAKLDLNALLAKKAEAETPAEGEDADAPETVADGEEEAEAEEKEPADYNALVKELLGIDLAAIAGQYAEIAAKVEETKDSEEKYVHPFGVKDAESFIAKLVEMLTPLSKVLDFLLVGSELTITLGEDIVLYGGMGYDYAIIPLLEAIGCAPVAATTGVKALEATLGALVARVDEIIANPVEEIFDVLAGLVYYLTSNALSTAALNLLKPAFVLIETISPIFDVMGLLNGIEIGKADENGVKKTLGEFFGGEINFRILDANFVIDLVSDLTGLNLTGLKTVFYDVVNNLTIVEYDSASSLQTTFKTATYSDEFNQADTLTVILSYLLEWVSVTENRVALETLLKMEGLADALTGFFVNADPAYVDPNWAYWFDSEEAFQAYLAKGELEETTLDKVVYPNDWDDDAAEYFGEYLDDLVDIVVSMIEIEGVKYENLASLLAAKVDVFNAETLNTLVDSIAKLLEGIDANLIDAAGLLLGVNIAGLKDYECTAEINSTEAFFAELANILDTYLGRLIDFLFFGESYKFAKKADAEGKPVDTLYINGGLGYEKGLALILEALGCELPDTATIETVFASIAARVDAILADPVNEVVELLPNLVYFLNANGAGAAVNNILAPVFALLDTIAGFGVELDLAGLLGFDLKYLTIADILALVESKTGLDLEKAEKILVDLCMGKIVANESGKGYKMVASAKDTITVLLTTAFALLSDEDFSAKLAEMTSVELIANINTVFAYGYIEYVVPDWGYCVEDGEVTGDKIPVIEGALTYPNNWNEEAADYIINNLPALVDTVIGMIKINDTNYATLGALLEDVLSDTNIYATDVLQGLIDMLAELLGDIDEELLKLGVIVDVDIVGLKNHKVGEIKATETQTVAQVFAAELANILTTYAKGLVEWLLLGRDFKFFVEEVVSSETDLHDIIVLNGANGYAEGLALILEALGCENLPTTGTTEEIVAGVLDSLAKRIDEIIANPVEEILALLPNLIYFINANGLAVAVNNIAAAPRALLAKLSAFGIEGDINKLINIEKIAGLADEEGNIPDLAIGVDNLTLAAVLELVGAITGLDLTVLNGSLANFALGELQAYTSVSGKTAYKMAYTDEFGRHDMITVVLTSVFATVFGNENNIAVLEEMLNTDLLTAIEDIFNPAAPEYSALPKYDYTGLDEIVGEVLNTNLTEYPTDWSDAKADWIAENLPVLADAIVGLIAIDGVKYESLGALLKAKVNVFTTENLQAVVDMLAELLGGIDAGLLEAAGLVLGVDLNGLAAYKAPADITTVEQFALELANILNSYAKGLVEWILLGEDYRFFVTADENGLPVDFITIKGTEGYAEGLALILEALGCKNLPAADGNTEAIVTGVLKSLAARINEILEMPVERVIDMLPGIIYFLNANGVAVVVDNLTAGIAGILTKLTAFGVNVNINDLVNLQELIGTTAPISLDDLSLATIIDVVAEKTGLDLTPVKEVFVNFALGEVKAYDSVSAKTQYTMVYGDDADKGDMLTAVLVAVLLTAFDERYDNSAKLEEMLGADMVAAIETVINDAPVAYGNPDWFYCAPNGEATGETTPVIESALTYPNDWNKEAVQYLTDNLGDLVDAVVALVKSDENATLAALLQGVLTEANIFSTATLESLLGLIQEIDLSAYEALLGAGMILDIDIKGLLKHKVPADIDTIDEFAAELANILTTYAKGLVEWLLLGNDFTFFYKNYDADKNPEAYITVNGAHGYANGLALILEALGCENLPAVDFAEGATNDTKAIVAGVLASIANRIDAILADPVDEIVALLPNLIYFINTNGASVAVNNMIAAVSTLLIKLKVFGVTNKDGEALTLADLVDLKTILGLEDTDAAISVNNLTLKSILEAVGLKTGLDLSVLETVLGEFALGKIETYESVSNLEIAPRKMVYADKFDKHHMVTVLLTSVLLTVFETEGNGEVIAEMLGTDLLTKIEDVFNNIAPSYKAPNWKYVLGDNTSLDSVIHQIMNPNNWTNEDSAYLAAELPEAVDMIVRQLSDAETLSELLGGVLADANIFTTETLNNVIGLLAGLLEDIDEGLVEVAGLVIDVDVNGLKKHTVPAGIDTIGEFAAELANILTTYAKGLVEWLLLGRDFKFFVKDVDEYGTAVDFITISGGQGYAEGLALILEAIGCKNLPAVEGKTTEEIVAGVLASLAARIDEIIANPVNEIIDLLPNLLYFINTNGLAVAVNNTIAAITALLQRLAYLGVELDLNELVDLKKLLGLPETALISLNKLDMEAILEIVEFKVPELSLKHIKNILVNFALGKLEAYDSVSVSEAYKMVYRDFGVVVDPELGLTQRDIDRGNMLTVVANTVVMVLEDEANFNFFFNLLGEKAMTVILSLFNFDEVPVQSFNWWNKEAADTGKIFSAFETSEMYKGDIVYGEIYTQEMSQYIADNFEEFVNNIIYLLGLDVNGDGKYEVNLTELINGLINGNLYNSANVIAIRDLLAGLADSINNITVSGIKVGPYIKMVLKLSKIADLDAIAKVAIPEFTENRAMFVEYICKILEPIAPVLKFVLADEDFRFFTTYDEVTMQPTDAITIKGAEGYAYGIIPLLELLECKDILAPEAYYAAVEADNGVLLTSILNPLLDRVDEIVANPAEEILEMLPNIIYFVNSNGVDTVVKNTLNAVYAVLDAISPIAKIDLYEIFGVDLATIDFNWIVDKVVEILGNQGYSFTVSDIMAINELTVGTIVSYKSVNGETAYKMVYSPNGGIAGGKAEMITIIERLVITFIADKKNQDAVVKFFTDKLGMGETGKEFLAGTIEVIAGALSQTKLGMQAALAAVYYLFYGLDIGAGETVDGLKDINKIWEESIKNFKDKVPGMGSILDKVFDIDGMDDIITEEGLAPNGFIAFFQRIANFFQRIADWFRNLFSFGKK